MGESKRIVENLKNVIIVVLFVTTILLLYLLWGSENSGKVSISEFLPFSGVKENTMQCSDVLVPVSSAWGEGDGSFRSRTVDLKEHQEYFLAQLKTLCQSDVVTYSITKDQFYQAIKENKSSVLQWAVDVPFEDFCRVSGIDSAVGEGIAYIRSLVISEAAKDSILLYDGENGRYYRLAAEGARTIPYDGRFDAVQGQYADDAGIYYPADVVLGSSSDALLPITESSDQCSCRYEPETESGGEDMGVEMAETVFGDTFDFVRRITDDFGTVTYMYGYGQKTLTANSDGSFEYKAETSGESAGFYSDLQTALDFVASCGGWESAGVEEITYRLADVSRSGSGKGMSYVFSFAACIKGCQVFSEQGYPIVVGISSGEVGYYYRSAFSLTSYAEDESRPVSEAANVIASNAGHMYKVMNDYALSADTDEAFSYVSNAVISMKKGYYMYGGGSTITPCWTVYMNNGSQFFFDLYEGVPLGFVR